MLIICLRPSGLGFDKFQCVRSWAMASITPGQGVLSETLLPIHAPSIRHVWPSGTILISNGIFPTRDRSLILRSLSTFDRYSWCPKGKSTVLAILNFAVDAVHQRSKMRHSVFHESLFERQIVVSSAKREHNICLSIPLTFTPSKDDFRSKHASF